MYSMILMGMIWMATLCVVGLAVRTRAPPNFHPLSVATVSRSRRIVPVAHAVCQVVMHVVQCIGTSNETK